MNSFSHKIEIMKLKLKSVTNDKLRNQRVEFTLRARERSISEEISLLSAESQFMQHQIEDFKKETSSLKHQIAMIELCNASEKSKIESHLLTLKDHTQAFDVLFKKERDCYESHNKQLRDMEAEEQEAARKQRAKALELDEQLGAEAALVEDQCEAIERECAVLTKRNRAIMLKLRRKLVETESTRRELFKQIENDLSGKN